MNQRLLLINVLMFSYRLIANDADTIIHFFTLPLDTNIATYAPAQEIVDSSGIRIIDIAYGKGELSAPNRRHYIRMIGMHSGTMEYFSTEYAGNKLFTTIPDSTTLLPGLKYALNGMRVGGRRRSIIPPRLAFGNRGYPSYGIKPNEWIIIDIELVKLDS